MAADRSSELILNSDGSIYHLSLFPGELSQTIILVGDPGRVQLVTRHFDSIELERDNREFVTCTGEYRSKRLSVVSSGISTSNIDIVLNEIDALFNVNLKNGEPLETHTELSIVRIGTAGATREEIPVDSVINARYAIGFDGLDRYYAASEKARVVGLERQLKSLATRSIGHGLYATQCDTSLAGLFESFANYGMSLTCQGFYGPQAREIRLRSAVQPLLNSLDRLQYDRLNVTNIEMETAGIFLLSSLLGHRSASLNVLLANRKTGEFSQAPHMAIERTIVKVLDALCVK